ncbi:hypothetical protein SLEP1_g13776 [Rubroshorea leprosula]|uniref:Uncharacterized protein n=1 Tax=Rubroshorea leprosula TaxID=152421 RepID=A0AAV5IRM5_9ROSI|nr:hypothetical protein SLEP1_g13776 [Rubroshorea leprosula]
MSQVSRPPWRSVVKRVIQFTFTVACEEPRSSTAFRNLKQTTIVLPPTPRNIWSYSFRLM